MDVFERFYDLEYAANDYWAFRGFYFNFQEPYLPNYSTDITERIRRVERNIDIYSANPDTGEMNNDYTDYRISQLVELGNNLTALENDILRRLATTESAIPDSEFPIGQRGDFETRYYDDLNECIHAVAITKEAVQQLLERAKRSFPGSFLRYRRPMQDVPMEPKAIINRPEVPVRRGVRVPAPPRAVEVGEPFIILKSFPDKTISVLYKNLVEDGCIDECGLGIFRAIFNGDRIGNKINWLLQNNQLFCFITELQRLGFISDQNHFIAAASNFTSRGKQIKGGNLKSYSKIAPPKKKPITAILTKSNIISSTS